MTKSIQELFDYIASSKFNPEMFKRDLNAHKDVNVDSYVGATKSTLLGQAAHALNASAVKILLDDFKASPDALTKGEGAQVWSPVYWTAYNSDKSNSVDIAKRLEILDLLYDAGATMDPLMKTAEYKPSCESLISYVKGTLLEDFFLHGASPKHTAQRNVGESHITKDTFAILERINATIIKNPVEYLYITALHSDVSSRLSSDAKEKALEALKNGAAPKIENTYTTRAIKLLDQIAQEFIQDPSLFLKTTLHADSKYLIEQDLVNLGSSLDLIAYQSYQNLTHQAIDTKLADGYTDNAANAISQLAEELKSKPTLLLYYTLHNNTVKEVSVELQELGVTLKEVGAKAREALESGVSPLEEVDGEYTTNAKAALEKIASNIKADPMKLLYVTLHDDSASKISGWLDANGSSVDAIKAQANAYLKSGEPITVSDALTPNAIEAMLQLAEELKSDPKLWLHISLNEDVINPLSEALVKAESSLDQVKKAAVDMLKNGENPQTEGKYTDNALDALGTLKSELSADPTQWLYIKLDSHAEQKLSGTLGLDLDAIKAKAMDYLAHGGMPKMEESLMTPNAASLIAELANKYIASNAVVKGDFFHEDVMDAITLQFKQSGKVALIEQLKTLAGKQVSEAIDETSQDAEQNIVSTKDQVGTKQVEAKTESSGWFDFLWGAPVLPNGGVKEEGALLPASTAVNDAQSLEEEEGVEVSKIPEKEPEIYNVTVLDDAELLGQEEASAVLGRDAAPEEM